VQDHLGNETEEEEFEDVECKVEVRPVVTIFQYLQAISFEVDVAVEIQCLESVNWDFVSTAIL